MSCEREGLHSGRRGEEHLPVARYLKVYVWISVVIAGLILLAASVVFVLKVWGLLPDEYTYHDIVIDAIVAPSVFCLTLLALGLGWEVVEFYLNRMPRRHGR